MVEEIERERDKRRERERERERESQTSNVFGFRDCWREKFRPLNEMLGNQTDRDLTMGS